MARCGGGGCENLGKRGGRTEINLEVMAQRVVTVARDPHAYPIMSCFEMVQSRDFVKKFDQTNIGMGILARWPANIR